MTTNNFKSSGTPVTHRKRADTNAKSLSAQIRKLALERGPSAKLPTARELCDTLGTTRATLHSALGELEAQNVITRKQGSGIFVSPTLHRKSITIALDSKLFSENAAASPFWGILLGILVGEAQKRSEATEQDYHFHLVTQQESEWAEKLLRTMQGGQTQGLLVIGLTNNRLVQQALESDLAIVSYAGKGRWEVTTDAEMVIALGAKALAEQGCRKIGLWHPANLTWEPEYETAIWKSRIAVFRQALAENNLPYDPALVKDYRHLTTTMHPGPPGIFHGQGYSIAMEVFRENNADKPDGVLCTDDMMTVGALAAFQKLGVQVGGDFKLASHINAGSLVFYGREDTMTLIEIDPTALAALMFDTLEQAIAGSGPAERLIKLKPAIRH